MDLIYDIETFPNCFTCSFEMADVDIKACFEISEYKDESRDLYSFLIHLRDNHFRMIGFNNIAFDYPVIHYFMKSRGQAGYAGLYDKAMAIIGSQDDNRWVHHVKPSDRIIQQIDLFKIHHFDNKSKITSLKMLEFVMRMDSIEELPFEVGTWLTQSQVQTLRLYNQYDVHATKQFYFTSLDMIQFREDLTKTYNTDFMNHNDVKIGTSIFEKSLEDAGISLYEFDGQGRTPCQTKRHQINLSDAILPWIQFERPELQQVLNWLRQQTITETKGVFKDLSARVDGFEFVFGLGGIHGSIDSEVVNSDDDYALIDLDVASYYPNLAIGQRFYPQHLTETFCDVYRQLFEQRKKYEKGTAENAMLKLALNGTYGQSNSPFSVFYDPLFTMSITLNGQLLLCLLAEQLLKIPALQLVQVNTDGLTIRVRREHLDHVQELRVWWEQMTGLELEDAHYKKMFIRDCNNYIAVYDK